MIGIAKNLGYLRVLRAVRSIRPIRLLIKSENNFQLAASIERSKFYQESFCFF